MRITQEQEKLLVEYVPNAKSLIEADDVHDLIFELDDVIIDKGMDKDQEINELGIELQKLYDEILEQNNE